jgi:rare lipoprotein A (peptidoglycan hydrolase)
MGIKRQKTGSVLAVIATTLCVGWFAVDAPASTGGVRAEPNGRSHRTRARASGHSRATRGTSAVATWFGPGLYGNLTACGQILTQRVIGVAHRTLPCGTLVRLEYRGRSLVAPVIDRGPYAPGVTWDLTAAAARVLRFAGAARVRALVVGNTPSTPEVGAPPAERAPNGTGGSAAD